MPANETIYAYAVGRIRALETRLLDKGKLERMVEAVSGEEALKVLSETDYAGLVAGLTSIFDFEKILQEEVKNVFTLMQKMSPRPYLTDLMSLKYDIHNLKVLLKAKYLEGANDNILFPVGTMQLDKLRAMVEEEDFRDLPATLRDTVEQILDEFIVSRDPQIIDLLLDQTLYIMLITAAREARAAVLEGLFIREVDLANIKTFLRVKRIGRNKEFFKRAFLPQGSLPLDLFISLLEEPLEILVNRLAMSEYAVVVGEGVQEWQEKGTFTRLEKLTDDFILEYLQQGKRTPFGLEPLVGYIYAKEIEIKNIRLILVGKINGLPIEAIRERLRNVYI
ncbi:MAG: V-type ATP synthase subunit C [Dethiobacteria bacterium]